MTVYNTIVPNNFPQLSLNTIDDIHAHTHTNITFNKNNISINAHIKQFHIINNNFKTQNLTLLGKDRIN